MAHSRGRTRRELLRAGAGLSGLLTIAGCSTGSETSGSTTTSETTTETTRTDKEAVLESLDRVENVSPLPAVDDSNADSTAIVSWQVRDPDGIGQASLLLTSGLEFERVVAEDRPEGSQAGGEARFAQQIIPPGRKQLEVRVEDEHGATYQFESASFSDDLNGYRLDPEQDFSSYSTGRSWDDTGFEQGRIDQQRSEWQQEARYEGFVTDVKNDRNFTERDIIYPNYEEAGGEGYFDLEIFRDTQDWEEMLIYIVNAARTETGLEHDGPPSGHANEMAASAEKAIEEVRGDDVRAWGIYNPGHGTMMFYTEDEEADHRWYHADTTSVSFHDTIQRPENALEHRRDIWSPFRSTDAEDQPGFHEGFDVDSVEGVNTYSQMKQVALGGLGRIVASGRPTDVGSEYIFATEEWLDDAYQHIREDGKIDSILDPLEELVDHQVQNDTKYAGIYGSGLDDTRIAAGDDLEHVYEDVMGRPGNVTADRIETLLEGQPGG